MHLRRFGLQFTHGAIEPFGALELDVTDLVTFDGANRLQVLVDGRSHRGPGRMGYGLLSNVWLCVEPKAPRLGQVTIRTTMPGRELRIQCDRSGTYISCAITAT